MHPWIIFRVRPCSTREASRRCGSVSQRPRLGCSEFQPFSPSCLTFCPQKHLLTLTQPGCLTQTRDLLPLAVCWPDPFILGHLSSHFLKETFPDHLITAVPHPCRSPCPIPDYWLHSLELAHMLFGCSSLSPPVNSQICEDWGGLVHLLHPTSPESLCSIHSYC